MDGLNSVGRIKEQRDILPFLPLSISSQFIIKSSSMDYLPLEYLWTARLEKEPPCQESNTDWWWVPRLSCEAVASTAFSHGCSYQLEKLSQQETVTLKLWCLTVNSKVIGLHPRCTVSPTAIDCLHSGSGQLYLWQPRFPWINMNHTRGALLSPLFKWIIWQILW